MTFDSDLTESDFLRAGYRKQSNGLMRNVGRDGRFHAKIKWGKNKNKFIDIHFDFWRSDRSGHPLVFYTPNMLKDEISRIKKA